MSAREFEENEDVLPTGMETESGYASGNSSMDALPEIFFSKPQLKHINAQLSKLDPQQILQWAVITLPSLYQSTAFGFSGLVTIDMLSKMSGPIKPDVDLIFLDTLYHFDETYQLVDKVKRRYPGTVVHVYKPNSADNAEEFEAKYGPRLWESNEELYDWTAKVEPQRRAVNDLQIKAMLTGRRKSQGGKRGSIDIVEVTDNGIIKVNPLANWSFAQVRDYIQENNVPYNSLADQGYKSIGDWHSTQPASEDEDERAGRWRGRQKTECGIHNPESRYAKFLREQAMKDQAKELAESLENLRVSNEI